jgi:hypothetical protein
MSVNKGDNVIYIDGLGKERNASVVDVNPMHPEFATLGYFDQDGNSQKVFDVPHFTHESRQEVRTVKASTFGAPDTVEGNPDIPTFHVNCWKLAGEKHNPLPSDHPAFDHPFKQPDLDQNGKPIPVVRTEYERVVAEHRGKLAAATNSATGLPSGDDLDKAAEEDKAATAIAGKPRIVKGTKA